MYGEVSTELSYLCHYIGEFEMIMDEGYNPLGGYYFTPKNSEKKYFVSDDYNYIKLDGTINATLVEEGNA